MKSPRQTRTTWTLEEVAILKEKYQTDLSAAEIAEELGKSVQSVYLKARDLQLKKRDVWTDAQILYLKKHYREKPMQELVLKLNRGENAIMHMASSLKIVRKNRKKDASKKEVNLKPGRKYRVASQKPDHLKRYATRKVEMSDKKPIRIDSKTLIYVPANASEKEVSEIIKRYKKED